PHSTPYPYTPLFRSTLGAMLTELQPDWDIRVYEKLDYVAKESSDPWNNAGTGHAALCELNYTPEDSNGHIDLKKASQIYEQFHQDRKSTRLNSSHVS